MTAHEQWYVTCDECGEAIFYPTKIHGVRVPTAAELVGETAEEVTGLAVDEGCELRGEDLICYMCIRRETGSGN